jgi:hypothetical protein
MFKYASRLAAIAAVVPISLALSAVPSHALVVNGGSVTVTGTATCNAATGHPTWTLHWTIDNTISIETPTRVPQIVLTPELIDINTADESGLVTADILSAVSPNPIPANGSATATDGPVSNELIGDVTLTVGYSGEFIEGSANGTVHLDGTCVLVEPTTLAPTTTAAPAVKTAVAAAPAFTG